VLGFYSTFLFYGVFIVATIFARWRLAQWLAPKKPIPLDPPSVPSNPDPYETAYLENIVVSAFAVVHCMVLSLTQRGYLRSSWHEKESSQALFRLTEEQKRHLYGEECIQSAPDHPDTQLLSPVERELFGWFSVPRTGEKVFWSKEPKRLIKLYCLRFDERLRNQGLLLSEEWERAMKRGEYVISIVAVLVILLVTWLVIRIPGLPVRVAIFMGILGCLLTLLSASAHTRCSPLGEMYLERLKSRFKSAKASVASTDPILPLLVALFGLDVVDKTEYAWISKLRDKSAPPDD